MRIGLSSTTFEPALAKGKIDGIGISTQNLYEEFKNFEVDVTPFYFPEKFNQTITPELPLSKSLRLPYMWSTIASLALPGHFLYPNLAKHIDIFHATDHMVPKIKKVPIIATINDALMFSHPQWHSVRLGNLKKIARKRTLGWADHYITISKAMVQEAVEYAGADENKISVVYLGVGKEWFIPISEEFKQEVLRKYNLPAQFVLFTGTLQQKKNLPRLVEAYLQLPVDLQEAYPLVVVGRAGWGMQDSLAAIDELTESKRGLWLKYVSTLELRALFQMSAAYLHPSLHEGFGLTLLEAFASGTPVLTSQVAALPEIADDAALLIDPMSVDEIREGIKMLLLGDKFRQSLVTKGKIRAQQFSWEKCARETLEVYKKVLG